ncbi:hypothetical protein AN639_02615 [Candidatus Epulonipiscium fishelsonii]|uniref:Uncharacterized protein n=1 Tax=Candidatus Epulonipiscium fishelsonii TaxID=77094 RepID=A0ACC8XA03_9FIRM|nr:hypothetical protein AN396_09500 [Epulopiscium sp. SCG-B11WGA-EpuloA1]ONI42019.1 hypothetical protein AN639_02615 [Epulopiscium sp. SCG-B05WGA-EpuloA1]
MNKIALKNFAIWARKKLIRMITDKMLLVGITENAILEPLDQSTEEVHFFDIGTTESAEVVGADIKKRTAIANRIREKLDDCEYKLAYKLVVEEVAYTWFNRLIAIRFMEVNDYLPTGVRVLSSEKDGKIEPDIVTDPYLTEIEFTDEEETLIENFKDNNKLEELFRFLFIKQCHEIEKVLPNLFEDRAQDDGKSQQIKGYTELLLNISFTDEDGIIRHLVNDIDEEDFKESVEIVGWLYQFYMSERKNEVVNIYKGVISKNDIPIATQLFSTDWVVRYMTDNSLGRYWVERNPNSTLQNKLEYFVTPSNYIDEKIHPKELTFFDPCMGSGHILVYAFDLLLEIYLECGYSKKEAAKLIIKNNIYGLDIDERAYQLAYFSLVMKARSYDRSFFSEKISPQVYCPIDNDELENLGSIFKPVEPEKLPAIMNNLNFKRLLSKTYTVVCTNPPYLNKYNPRLKEYINDNYKDYDGDLFSVFIYRNFDFCKPNGYSAFMTPFVWMFIKTYERLRQYIINNKSIISLIQMEYSAFEESTVPICSFILKNCKETEKGLYFKLSDFKGGMQVQKEKVLEALSNNKCGYLYEASQENFTKIPSSPIAYWMGENMLKVFENGTKMGDYGIASEGIKTGNNNRFLRLWFEVNSSKFSFAQEKTGSKWYPHHKGGEYRKWYGNLEYVINWENNGEEIRQEKNSGLQGKNMYFSEILCWSKITSKGTTLRYIPRNCLFDSGSPAFKSSDNLMYVLGFINSIGKIILSTLNPTLNCQVGDIKALPLIINNDEKNDIDTLVEENISISKKDWDSFETSWDFIKHPLI